MSSRGRKRGRGGEDTTGQDEKSVVETKEKRNRKKTGDGPEPTSFQGKWGKKKKKGNSTKIRVDRLK